jgi:hypothetical protein
MIERDHGRGDGDERRRDIWRPNNDRRAGGRADQSPGVMAWELTTAAPISGGPGGNGWRRSGMG